MHELIGLVDTSLNLILINWFWESPKNCQMVSLGDSMSLIIRRQGFLCPQVVILKISQDHLNWQFSFGVGLAFTDKDMN